MYFKEHLRNLQHIKPQNNKRYFNDFSENWENLLNSLKL